MLAYALVNINKQYSSFFLFFSGRGRCWRAWCREDETFSGGKLSCKPKVLLCVKKISLIAKSWQLASLDISQEEWQNIFKTITQVHFPWFYYC